MLLMRSEGGAWFLRLLLFPQRLFSILLLPSCCCFFASLVVGCGGVGGGGSVCGGAFARRSLQAAPIDLLGFLSCSEMGTSSRFLAFASVLHKCPKQEREGLQGFLVDRQVEAVARVEHLTELRF